MQRLILFTSFLFLSCVIISCASSNQCSSNRNFRIDYYSGGGFTGMESGITITCDGTVKFWKKKLNSLRETTDSLQLSGDKLSKIDSLMDNPEIFKYNEKYSDNYTTNLIVLRDIQINRISFNGIRLPSGMPASVVELINEIKNITKK